MCILPNVPYWKCENIFASGEKCAKCAFSGMCLLPNAPFTKMSFWKCDFAECAFYNFALLEMCIFPNVPFREMCLFGNVPFALEKCLLPDVPITKHAFLEMFLLPNAPLTISLHSSLIMQSWIVSPEIDIFSGRQQ